MKNSLMILFLFVLSFTVSGQYEQYEKKSYNNLNYRILYPDNFDGNQQYPVLLFLHGAGERGDNNESQLVHGGKLFLSETFRAQYPAVVIFPQCPKDSYWSRVDVDRSTYPLSLDFHIDESPTVPMQLVLDLMDSIANLNYSDNERMYVGGLSMGGMGTFEIIYRDPEMFAAAFPICGGGDPSSVSAYADKLAIWVFHGAKDNVVLPSFSTNMVIALMKAGADVKYTLYKDANHNSWDSAFAEPGLIPWIFSNKKDSGSN